MKNKEIIAMVFWAGLVAYGIVAFLLAYAKT